MRNKTLGINVRVTPDEKEKLCQNAKYCGKQVYAKNLKRLSVKKTTVFSDC